MAPIRMESLVALLEGGHQVDSVWIGAGQRAHLDGVSVYQVDDGPAVRVTVRDEQGQPLDLAEMVVDAPTRPMVRLAFRGSQQEQLLVSPPADLVVRLLHYGSLPSQGIAGRALQVQLSRWSDGQVLLDRFLDSDTALRVPADGAGEALSVEVALETYAVLRAEQEPELLIALLGGLVGLLGMVSCLLWPPRRAWVLLSTDGFECVCRLDVAERDAHAEWVNRLRAALELGEGEA